jgi:hypothetical protein
MIANPRGRLVQTAQGAIVRSALVGRPDPWQNRAVEPRTAILAAPAEEWADVQRWNLRAQALAELRALSEREGLEGTSARTIVLP